MSPASQGALEVERYIGSCLISTGRPALAGCRKQEQQQQQQQQGLRTAKQCQNQFGTWAGGAPLISMASNPRRNNQRSSPQQQQQQALTGGDQQQLPPHLHNRMPLSRLAVHTQGAPLILSGRFPNNRGKIHNGPTAATANVVAGLLGNNHASKVHPSARSNKPPTVVDQKKPQQASTGKLGEAVNKDASMTSTTTATSTAAGGPNVASIDSLSIASDESSGSNNSENSLPRIIKPRKRRKKDRKPPVVGAGDVKTAEELQQQQVPVNSAVVPNGMSEQQQQQQQPMTMKPYQPNSYDNARYPGDNYYKNHRRPMNNGQRDNVYGRVHLGGNNCSSNSSNPTTLNGVVSNPQQEVVDTRQQQQPQQQARNNGAGYAGHRHVQVKVLDDNRNVILPVPVCQAKAAAAVGYLRHNHAGNTGSGGARFLHDYNEPVTLACHQDTGIDDCLQAAGSLCQCHYCDPATLIWDVSDPNGYTPQFLAQPGSPDYHHHHHHHHRFSQVPATTVFLTTARPIICQEHGGKFYDVAENPCLRIRAADRADGAAILRRSWSDPTSYFSEEIVPNRDVGVIGDRGQSGESSSKGRSSWRGDASTAGPSSPTSQSSSPTNGSGSGVGILGPQGPLEVSTEIVTSPNGHRDLEIKFYSSSPTSYTSSPEDFKTSFTFPDDSEEPDSDIWSYHESKLQQDFRTLLQAEE